MKTPILGLVVAAAAFAGSSIYLAVQLGQERDRAAQVADTTRKLTARIAELEKARDDMNRRQAAVNGAVTGSFSSFGVSMPPGALSARAAPAAPSSGETAPPPEAVVWSNQVRQRSPAFEKMMRNQARVSARRQYAGVGEELGLGKEKAAKLVELLAEQQASMMILGNEADPSKGAPFDYEQRQREQEMEISNLIGDDKAEQLKAYQATLPARMESEMLARQLEDNGVPLSETQKKELTKVVIAEHDRLPTPPYDEGMDQAEYMKAINDWKNDYDKRIADEAGHILNAEQLAAYNDIQQWQKEMREQFAVAGMTAVPAGARVRRMVAPGGAVTYTNMAPAQHIEATIVNGVEVTSARVTTEEEPRKP